MKKLIILTIIAMIAMIGTASAGLTHDGAILNALGTADAPNPITIKPGETITLSYEATNLVSPSGSEPYNYTARSTHLGDDGDITILFANDFAPTTAPTYVDKGVITLSLDSNAPVGAIYEVTVQVPDSAAPVFIYGRASREIESIPEFPTIALPVAAILGLAFFFQRRKEE